MTVDIKFNAEEYLKKLHTKQLVNLRDKIYKTKPINDFKEGLDIASTGLYDVSDSFKNWYVSMEQVKSELKTREHIPNKAEAKEIRQQKAKKH